MRSAAELKALWALFFSILGLILLHTLCRSNTVVTIYVITPTFYRITQKPELVRLCNTFSLVENIHWIVVEDSHNKTDLVANFLSEYKNYHIKGSNQRNAGMQWLRENIVKGKQRGVVYFADDDNTYDPRIFAEMRDLQQQEGTLLSQVGFKSALDLEPRANGCSKILVWHTKTQVPHIPKQRPHQPSIADFL
ncbi:Galactosylgalactosylxylosylprotein 3-beta-glucuronosyltransferase 1 [Taenia crassiceps]|uniref:Galactosylgalactosylxylosylprotein 3-beta-glucuronosyltransferase n=1 Tax=Taenia crassiceps TaxID=6207 RepID=A0ABR4QIA2_9CEST